MLWWPSDLTSVNPVVYSFGYGCYGDRFSLVLQYREKVLKLTIQKKEMNYRDTEARIFEIA